MTTKNLYVFKIGQDGPFSCRADVMAETPELAVERLKYKFTRLQGMQPFDLHLLGENETLSVYPNPDFVTVDQITNWFNFDEDRWHTKGEKTDE